MTRAPEFISLSGARAQGWMTRDEVNDLLCGTEFSITQYAGVCDRTQSARAHLYGTLCVVCNEPSVEVMLWRRDRLVAYMTGQPDPWRTQAAANHRERERKRRAALRGGASWQ